MPIFEPTISLLRQALGNRVQDCQTKLIKLSLEWSHVYRVTLKIQGHSKRTSVIVKTIDPTGSPTPLEGERELRFYQTIHPTLSIPKPDVHLLTTDETTGLHVIVMQDLAPTHRTPSAAHQWSRDELRSVLCTYAHLHTSQMEALTYPWLAPRYESQLNLEIIPEQAAIVQQAGIWGVLPELHDLIAYARESCQKYAAEHLSILHGDTTPANALLPKGPDARPATLIDWQDVGLGMPEFDLAYIDQQPFEGAHLIPRPELLELYWQYRAEISSDIPCSKERHARQLHADVVAALWLTAAAGRVTLQPYIQGTPQHAHWKSLYKIVYNRLRSLAAEINDS